MKCRSCGAKVSESVVDLGTSPPSNSFVTAGSLAQPEIYYPLKTMVCTACWLVQIDEVKSATEIFSEDYVYFSSFSSSWLDHARRYAHDMIERFALGPDSFVAEIASNDGYLLKNFVAAGIPCLGIEPTASTARAARAAGVETREAFFGRALGAELAAIQPADLTAANNVLAHVPDINDFVGGFANFLAPEGVSTFEFPHLQEMIANNQFDTIYHEHYSYLSLTAVSRVFARNGMRIFDVERLSTHGGSLRLYACRRDSSHVETSRVAEVLEGERRAGVETIDYYRGFQAASDRIKRDFLKFLIEAKENGKQVVGYGAAAKGNTLLNFCGVRPDLLEFVVDLSPHKQGRFLPGARIPVLAPDALIGAKPDYVVILPWNLRDEISNQLAAVREWGGQFVVAVPGLEIF